MDKKQSEIIFKEYVLINKKHPNKFKTVFEPPHINIYDKYGEKYRILYQNTIIDQVTTKKYHDLMILIKNNKFGSLIVKNRHKLWGENITKNYLKQYALLHRFNPKILDYIEYSKLIYDILN